MKIYISGKITGDRRYKAKFREVEKKLAAAGHIVLNPATAPEGLRPVDYMRLCFAMMEAADVVLFMQDYQDSRGAMLEWAWCQYVGKQTWITPARSTGKPSKWQGAGTQYRHRLPRPWFGQTCRNGAEQQSRPWHSWSGWWPCNGKGGKA